MRVTHHEVELVVAAGVGLCELWLLLKILCATRAGRDPDDAVAKDLRRQLEDRR